jgi:hypothetical protein
MIVIAIFAGVILAVPYLRYARRAHNRNAVFGLGLITAAVVYVVFAVLAGSLRQVLIELAGVALFGILAVLGFRRWFYFLVAGWTAHVGWDLLPHPMSGASYVPWWYPVACIGFDLVVAAAILKTNQ